MRTDFAMVAEVALDLIPKRDGQANSRGFRGRPIDLHSFCAVGAQKHHSSEAVATISKGFSAERCGASEVKRVAVGGQTTVSASSIAQHVNARTSSPPLWNGKNLSILGGATHSEALPPAGSLEPPSPSIIDFATPMNRATVEDSTAGLGQPLRTVRPLVVGLSDHDVSGLCMSSLARGMPEVLAVGRLCGGSVDSTARHSRQCEHELELRDGVENRMLPSEEKQQNNPRW